MKHCAYKGCMEPPKVGCSRGFIEWYYCSVHEFRAAASRIRLRLSPPTVWKLAA